MPAIVRNANYMRYPIIIPALNPDSRLISYCKELVEAVACPVLLVDDGSDEVHRPVFQRCLAIGDQITLLRHDVNQGKGRALKTAFGYLFERQPLCQGCVTCDSDGQHAISDVIRCMEALAASPEALVLGCRQFDLKGVPWKSRFGNTWMRFLFLLVSGYRFVDTQTGLRAIPGNFMRELLEVPGERFEFETEMLLRLHGRPLVQIPIETIYENGNEGTHFRPLADSAKILGVLLRSGGRRFGIFILVSLASFGVDIGLFHCLHAFAVRHQLAGRLFFAVGLSRFVSLFFNYLCNRHIAFGDEGRRALVGGRALGKYLCLAVGLLLASYLLTKLAVHCFPGAPVTFLKACVDLSLFFVSYGIQRAFVFKPGRG